MELIILISLLCLGFAAQPFAAKRLSAAVQGAVVQGAVGSVCVGVSLALMALVASGFVSLPGGFSLGQQARAAELPDVDLPPPATKESTPSPSEAAPLPDDESTFFAPADDSVIIPPGRPEWVEAPPVREGAVHTTSICSEPYATHQQAVHALDEKLLAATSDYVKEHLQSDLAGQLIRFNLDDVKQKLLRRENTYHEKIQVSIGPMHQVHARLEFTEGFREELARRWSELRAIYRLAQTGLISGGVLLLLATVFGYFRLDNATRGYYTGRLQFMAAAAILAIVASGVMFSRWIYWL